MTKTYYKTGEYEFMECADCAAKPGSPILCPACYHNRTVIDRLNRLIATTRRETVEECRRWINYAMLPYPNKYGNTISVSRHNRMIEELEELLDNIDQLPDKQEK